VARELRIRHEEHGDNRGDDADAAHHGEGDDDANSCDVGLRVDVWVGLIAWWDVVPCTDAGHGGEDMGCVRLRELGLTELRNAIEDVELRCEGKVEN
jgi:hypothetical protein